MTDAVKYKSILKELSEDYGPSLGIQVQSMDEDLLKIFQRSDQTITILGWREADRKSTPPVFKAYMVYRSVAYPNRYTLTPRLLVNEDVLERLRDAAGKDPTAFPEYFQPSWSILHPLLDTPINRVYAEIVCHRIGAIFRRNDLLVYTAITPF